MKYMNKSIEELHELLKEGKVTERELIDESLELSKKVEEENNAFVTILDNIEEKEVLNVVEAYSNALTLLDDYDHGCVSKTKGKNSIYQLTYEECRILIDSMGYGGFSSVFGVEKNQVN